MDAEQMLEFLVDHWDWVTANIHGTAVTAEKRRNMIRDALTPLEPLIRSGLALQRLERWLPEGHEFNIGRAYGVYGAQVWKMIGEHRVSGTGQTLLEAINAALDAAGAE